MICKPEKKTPALAECCDQHAKPRKPEALCPGPGCPLGGLCRPEKSQGNEGPDEPTVARSQPRSPETLENESCKRRPKITVFALADRDRLGRLPLSSRDHG